MRDFLVNFEVNTIQSVIVFLYDKNNQFLFHLRDGNPDIIFPNHWGLFGGEMMKNESPKSAAIRELQEEIEYVPEEILEFRSYHRQDLLKGKLQNYCIKAFYGKLKVEKSELALNEGADLGIFSVDECYSGQMFSSRFQKKFPIIPHLFDILNEFLNESPHLVI